MVWLPLLRELGGVCDPYDYEGGDFQEQDYDPTHVDKVEPETVGRLHTIKLRDVARDIPIDEVALAMDILTDKDAFVKHVAPDPEKLKVNKGRASNALYPPIMVKMASWTLIFPHLDQTMITCFCLFFTVAKSNGLRRIIFDCRALNAASKTPPPVNLCQIPEILKMASSIGATHMVTFR